MFLSFVFGLFSDADSLFSTTPSLCSVKISPLSQTVEGRRSKVPPLPATNLPSRSWKSTPGSSDACRLAVASFQNSPDGDPLFSIKSVASFFKNAISLQPLEAGIAHCPLPIVPCLKELVSRQLPYLLATVPALNVGFVPDILKRRSFVFNQIGGFVFQESRQPSAFSPIPRSRYCPLPIAYCP